MNAATATHTVMRVGYRHAEVEGETMDDAIANASDTTFGSEVDCQYVDPNNFPPEDELKIITIEGRNSHDVDGAFMVCGMPATQDANYDLIAASPLIKQDKMTSMYRVVLRRDCNGDFVVHNQHFPESDNLHKFHYEVGGYCGNSLQAAMKCFAERVTRQAGHCELLGKTS